MAVYGQLESVQQQINAYMLNPQPPLIRAVLGFCQSDTSMPHVVRLSVPPLPWRRLRFYGFMSISPLRNVSGDVESVRVRLDVKPVDESVDLALFPSVNAMLMFPVHLTENHRILTERGFVDNMQQYGGGGGGGGQSPHADYYNSQSDPMSSGSASTSSSRGESVNSTNSMNSTSSDSSFRSFSNYASDNNQHNRKRHHGATAFEGTPSFNAKLTSSGTALSLSMYVSRSLFLSLALAFSLLCL
jgi:hypothetical protein